MALIKEVLAALRIVVVEKEGYEADDVIATLTTMARADDAYQVLISSGDRDAIQLVEDQVTILYPLRGVSELIRLTPEVVLERYGVEAGQLAIRLRRRREPPLCRAVVPGGRRPGFGLRGAGSRQRSGCA